MEAAGVNDFIVDNTYESYKTIPTLNKSYQGYINELYVDAETQIIPKLINLNLGANSFIAIGVEQEGINLSIYNKNEVIVGNSVVLTKITKQQELFSDETINFKKINSSIQKYWIEDESLIFGSDSLLISNYISDKEQQKQTKESQAQNLSDFVRRYLEASYPFVVLSLVSQLIPQNFDFLNFYDGWNAEGQQFANTEEGFYNPKDLNLDVKFNGYLKYTKQILRDQLIELQKDSIIDTNNEETLNEEAKFANLKKDFGL